MVETSTRVEGRVFTHNVGWVPEHLKHPLKTVDRYWSPVSDHDQMACSGDVVAPYIPIMVGYMEGNEVLFSFLVSGSHVSAFIFGWNGGWPCTDGAHRYGGRPLGIPPRRPSFLDLERARQSSGRLRRRFQINYPRSSPILGMRRCVEPAP